MRIRTQTPGPHQMPNGGDRAYLFNTKGVDMAPPFDARREKLIQLIGIRDGPKLGGRPPETLQELRSFCLRFREWFPKRDGLLRLMPGGDDLVDKRTDAAPD